MPIPPIHLQRLNRGLIAHEAALARLDQQRMQLETETVIHRTLLKLGRDSDILNLINELYENPELIEELRKNCSSVLRQRGILLPEGVTVSVIEEPGRGVRADFTINGTKVFAQWSPKVGFFITTEYAPSPLPGTLSLTRNRTR